MIRLRGLGNMYQRCSAHHPDRSRMATNSSRPVDVPCGLHGQYLQYVSFPRTWRCRNRHAWHVLRTGTVPVLYLPDTSRMIRQALPRPSIADHALSKIQSAVQKKYRTEYDISCTVLYGTISPEQSHTKCPGPMRRHDYPISLVDLRNEAGKL